MNFKVIVHRKTKLGSFVFVGLSVIPPSSGSESEAPSTRFLFTSI